MKLPHGRPAHEGGRPAWLRALALRRQRDPQLAAVLSDPYVAEQGIAELYAEAVEQLDSDKAPVRLGGLYALEGLAQDNPAFRQIIGSVLCAYLRGPFSATAPASEPEPGDDEGQHEPGAERHTGADGIGGTWQEEREVRLTAQRILAEHLCDDRAKDQRGTDPPSTRLWNNISLDLTGATLIDFSLVNGVVADANFRRASFTGDTSFGGAVFGGDARFTGATFTGDASFGGVTFGGAARFGRVTFGGDVSFGGASFSGAANFPEADFRGDARFGGASFTGDARFAGAVFGGDASFARAAFGGDARFRRASFASAAGFGEVIFGGGAWFDKAAFGGDASFDAAVFGGAAGFGEAAFSGDAWFDQATFRRGASFGKATFTGDAWFGEVTFGGGASFGEVAFTGDAWFGEVAFTSTAGFGEAAFIGDAWFGEVTFGGDASFGEVAFTGDAWFGRAAFTGGAWFSEAAFTGGADALHFEEARILSPGASHVWPAGWRLADSDGGGYTVVRAYDDSGS